MTDSGEWYLASSRYHRTLTDDQKKMVDALYNPWHQAQNGEKTLEEFALKLNSIIDEVLGEADRIQSLIIAADEYEENIRAEEIMERLNESR